MHVWINFLWPALVFIGLLSMLQHHLPIAGNYFTDTDVIPNIGIALTITGAVGSIIEAFRRDGLFTVSLVGLWGFAALSLGGINYDWFCEGFQCLAWIWPWFISMGLGLILSLANAVAFYRLATKGKKR